jgi:dTDP-4-dehydrorhamnose 3,5-epimerase
MAFTTTSIPGVLVFEPTLYKDSRGYFFESYNAETFRKEGIETVFVQDNQSFSARGVIRGLHYQLPPHAQTKLVRVVRGAIIDVALDIRKGSPTYGQAFCIELSADNKKQLYIPKGCAHGFSVLSETAELAYKCDAFFHKESDNGIYYNDLALNIDWQVPEGTAIISEKDLKLPPLSECKNTFVFEG